MEILEARTPSRLLRLLLCGLGVAAGLVLLGLAFGSHSASADEPGTPPAAPSSSSSGSGLLGSVGYVLGAVTAPVSDTVSAVTSTVSNVVNPVTQSLPAPVQQVVQPVTDAVTTATQSVSITHALAPVTGVVDQVVGSVPVVGPTISSALGSLSKVTVPVTGTIDAAAGNIGTITGIVFTPPAPGGGVPPVTSEGSSTGSQTTAVPALTSGPSATSPQNALPASASGNAVQRSSSLSVSVVATRTAASISDATVPVAHDRVPPSAPGTPGAGGSATGTGTTSGGGSGAGSAFNPAPDFALSSLGSGLISAPPGDDRRTSTPTYETDSTPD
ncbi:hypothetical protein [Humibacter sp.]|uniref:hypothetical protein n=1 Tax=Humibacter sp. TaxID=1940291 RepID=UPI003F7D0B4F